MSSKNTHDKGGRGVHVLGVASSLVLVVCGDVDDLAGLNGQVSVILGVTCADLGALGVKSNGDGPAILHLNGLAGVVNDGLVVLV